MKQSLNDIPIGRKNAISRAALAAKWGCSDRMARRYISELRCVEDERYVIVSHSNGGVCGYYRTDDPNDIEYFLLEMTKRARNTFRPLRQARRVLKRLRMEGLHGKGLAG